MKTIILFSVAGVCLLTILAITIILKVNQKRQLNNKDGSKNDEDE